ncbi:MAG: peptidylprolyl isomerase [Cyanobacteria bacterium REEB65]|nr:peptidylprolyl isomerase [Cyanobacteria bacterium REEB65]
MTSLAQVAKVDGFRPAVGHHVLLHTTKGDIVIALFDRDSPKTAANFEKLVRKGFYDNTKFHRVIDGFMAQGGDPKGTGEGGPGYTIAFERNRLKHLPGAIAMARTQDPNSAGSQFFIDFARNSFLDERFGPQGPDGYVVFGQVVRGMDVVNRLTRTMDHADAPIARAVPDKVVQARLLD